jgi:hypothetical protein
LAVSSQRRDIVQILFHPRFTNSARRARRGSKAYVHFPGTADV